MEPGRYEAIDFTEYLALHYLSRSAFRYLARSPGAYRSWLEDGEDEGDDRKEDSVIGQAIHCLLLTPDLFEDSFVVAPYCHKSWKDETVWEKRSRGECKYEGGAETWAQFTAQYPDAEYVTTKDMERIHAIAEKMRAIDVVRRMLEGEGGASEVTYVWDDPETGVRLKCRPDRIYGPSEIASARTVLDLKTTGSSVTPRSFGYSTFNRAYHVQAYLAQWALEIVDGIPMEDTATVFLAWETKRPYRVEGYWLDSDDLALAAQEVRRLIRLYAECVERDQWPDSSGLLRKVQRPTNYREMGAENVWFPKGRTIDQIPQNDMPF